MEHVTVPHFHWNSEFSQVILVSLRPAGTVDVPGHSRRKSGSVRWADGPSGETITSGYQEEKS